MVTIDVEEQLVTIKVKPHQEFPDLQKMIIEQLNHPDYRQGMDELWDFREAQLTDVTEKDLRHHAYFVKEAFPGVQKRIALVVRDDLQTGIIRQWMTYAEIGGAVQDRQLFDCIYKAKLWFARKRFEDSS